jgi:hypothetical protein
LINNDNNVLLRVVVNRFYQLYLISMANHSNDGAGLTI